MRLRAAASPPGEPLRRWICPGAATAREPPFGGAVVAGDQARAVQAAEVSVDECVARFGLLRGALREAEMPLGVLVPRVRSEECILVLGLGLDLAPVAVEHVLAPTDETPRPSDRSFVHNVGGDERILTET